jgi:hypothetical protein
MFSYWIAETQLHRTLAQFKGFMSLESIYGYHSGEHFVQELTSYLEQVERLLSKLCPKNPTAHDLKNAYQQGLLLKERHQNRLCLPLLK